MADDDDNSILGGLKKMAELEGYREGTPGNERRVRQLKVIKCRELRGVSFCSECKYYDDCELIKQVMREQQGYEE